MDTDAGRRPHGQPIGKETHVGHRARPADAVRCQRSARDRKPLYIGVPSVRIPKKFRITEIVKENVAKIALVFIKHFKGD